jgi:hypothetical protein
MMGWEKAGGRGQMAGGRNLQRTNNNLSLISLKTKLPEY